MNTPKKVDLLSLKKNKDTAEEVKEVQKKEGDDSSADKILERYKPVEETYQQVGQERAEQDKKKYDELNRLNQTSFKSTFNMSLRDNDEYEEIRKQTRGVVRLGYRHVFKFGLKQLLKMSREEIVKNMIEIDEEYKKMGINIK